MDTYKRFGVLYPSGTAQRLGGSLYQDHETAFAFALAIGGQVCKLDVSVLSIEPIDAAALATAERRRHARSAAEKALEKLAVETLDAIARGDYVTTEPRGGGA